MNLTAEQIAMFGLGLERILADHETRLLEKVTAHVDAMSRVTANSVIDTVAMKLDSVSAAAAKNVVDTVATKVDTASAAAAKNVVDTVATNLDATSRTITDTIAGAVKTLQTSILSLAKLPNDPDKAIDLMHQLEEAALLGEAAGKAREAAKSAQSSKIKQDYEELAQKASDLQTDALKQAMDIVGLP